MVINIRKFIDQKRSMSELQDISTYFFDWVEKYFLVQGRVESWFLLMDCSDIFIS